MTDVKLELPLAEAIPVEILRQCRQRDGSVCPSEVARALGGEPWRGLMPAVRAAATQLAAAGLIEITQGGQAVDLAQARGPVRLRLRRSAPDSG